MAWEGNTDVLWDRERERMPPQLGGIVSVVEKLVSVVEKLVPGFAEKTPGPLILSPSPTPPAPTH